MRSIHAGSAANVIPESGTFQATVRSFSVPTHRLVRAGIARVLHGVAEAHGVRVVLDHQENYPVTVNDPAEAEFIKSAHNIYNDCDLVLPLSDHADFDELVRTARESGARKVWTTHGPASFAHHLRAAGIDAEHIASHPQPADEPGLPGQLSMF